MDLSETQYTYFDTSQFPKGNTNQQPSLTNYIAPNDEFYSLNITFPNVPTKVNLVDTNMNTELLQYPLPIAKEGYMNIDNIQMDSYVDLTNYKINYPGDGSLVNLTKLLEQLNIANIPVGKESNNGYSIYEGFADLNAEDTILYDPDSEVSRFYIASLSIVGLFILYRMMKL